LLETPHWREMNRPSGSHRPHKPDAIPRGDLSNQKISPN
jgi:hypothetical protein